jgi:hypothetical protein
MVESPAEEILTALSEYINRRVRFRETIIGWPDSSRKLSLPAVSFMVKTPRMRHFHSELQTLGTIKEGKADPIYVVGEWEFSIQMDLWLKTKAERYDALEKMFHVFYCGDDEPRPVLHIKLEKYHKTKASYYLRDYSIPDDSQTAINQEWRAIIDITATCDMLVERENEAIILESELNLEIE